ncbi:MarR family winged helix-turn-helix transcriptional regulator [Mangrovicoccus algicola]|uniref:MarR family transcriptional regulator n=1 Tax=Mangrovicoccus algicola TaxID=2771008 RepID=A0A8J6YW31_9RHOB|nr:MarR family transcriptional regulator [Mangrovicoccus algicola]MBE3636846.1 MarR family transcriptional regulator [Mangrovicoccus algicola]
MTSPVQREFLPEIFGMVRAIRKRFNARAVAIGMTYARAQALMGVAVREGLTQAELAERLDIRTPSMNRTLDHLEEQGLIERRACAQDKRIRQLYLTPMARAQAEDVVGFTEDLRREVYRGISEDELAQTLSVIRRIQKNLDGMA